MWWLLVLLMSAFNTSGALEERAQPVEAMRPAPMPDLRIVGIYGERDDIASDLSLVMINLEMPAGSAPQDFTTLILRFSDGTQTANFGWSPRIDPQAEERPTQFDLEWIRGDGTNSVARAGDLIQIRFMPPTDLPERTDVTIDLIPEVGPPAEADFRTPPTYSDDYYITLR